MKKVAILGFGSEGLSAYKYFKGRADITVFDENPTPNQKLPTDVRFVTGKDCFKDLRGFDVVVRFPAISPDRFTADGEVTSVTREFFKACTAPIIGVTGTKGKGTTSSMIHAMLNAAGIKSHLAGNIGVPALDILPKVKPHDVVVLELSSFQLWDLDRSPHVAVVLMVEPEHQDIHAGVGEYLAAKTNLVQWQNPEDVTVYLPNNPMTAQVALAGEGQKIPYTQPPGAYVEDNMFVIGGQKVCKVGVLKLPGAHNQDNACAAITAAWQFTHDTQAITKALGEFEGLEHRLKFVREVQGIMYYDDSFATTPTSAVASLKAFSQPKIIILGGSDKGAQYDEVAKTAMQSDMHGVILIGLMRHKLKEAFIDVGYKGIIKMFDETTRMPTIVQAAASMAKKGDVVVLSPACASFDMFKNYKDRGEQFIAAVRAL